MSLENLASKLEPLPTATRLVSYFGAGVAGLHDRVGLITVSAVAWLVGEWCERYTRNDHPASEDIYVAARGIGMSGMAIGGLTQSGVVMSLSAATAVLGEVLDYQHGREYINQVERFKREN